MPSKSEPSRRIGSGTTDDPMIIWVKDPPADENHKSKIEGIARELGQRGKTHIWLRYLFQELCTSSPDAGRDFSLHSGKLADYS
ncbi:hypothetical protein N7456_006447 [Penicillium angulare]|uniref:Uncharacterized protein n=1 Tax=Penicillium angulare TaxID=116970 RepID=A0A9W9KBN8_9EURO|nr:hypothetical protein N7456_006447 [Penicillium angulare]